MKPDRTRIIFFAIIALTLLTVCAALIFRFANRQDNGTGGQTTGTTPVTTRPSGGQSGSLTSPTPVWGPNYSATDGRPTWICGADAFGSYYVLQQMQMSGTDIKNGFHLGIVPFLFNDDPAYDISEEQRTALLDDGQWNCLLTTLDSVALSSPGVITAIVDESAGADQLWGRNIATINDLKGKRIAFARNSVGEYFTYYTLSIARLNPRFDVTLVPRDNVADAVATFNAGQADAVAAWEPDIYDAAQSGGVSLLSSNQLRIVIDVIVTSRQVIAGQPDLVQSFHNAWFETLKNQVENFAGAAGQIAAWGHNDWSLVYPESAESDLTDWLESVAQADLGNNAAVMRDVRPIVDRLNIARRVWAASGISVPQDDPQTLVNPNFVALAAQQPALQPSGRPVNPTFSIAATLDLSGVSDSQDAVTLAVLPCRRFTFLPESTQLTIESRRQIDDCVLPTMLQSVGLFLEVKGSSAWPGPPGTFGEQEIYDFAEARAQSVVNYLVSQGLDPARFIVTATLPPLEHRETSDANIQAEDRFVEMTLITSGR
jgi:ABC-type amino acid transport substrate-binding protein